MTEKYQVGQEPLVNQKKYMMQSIFTFNLFLLGFVCYVTDYTYTYSIMVNIAFKFESNTIFSEFLSSELTYVPSIPCKWTVYCYFHRTSALLARQKALRRGLIIRKGFPK